MRRFGSSSVQNADGTTTFFPLIIPKSTAGGSIVSSGNGMIDGRWVPAGFDLTIPGVVDIHGTPVGGAPPPSVLQQALGWLKANPLLAVGIAAGGYMLATRKKR